jgi:hypothetical protein
VANNGTSVSPLPHTSVTYKKEGSTQHPWVSNICFILYRLHFLHGKDTQHSIYLPAPNPILHSKMLVLPVLHGRTCLHNNGTGLDRNLFLYNAYGMNFQIYCSRLVSGQKFLCLSPFYPTVTICSYSIAPTLFTNISHFKPVLFLT